MGNTNANLDQMPKKNPLSFQIDLNKFEKATDEEKRQQEVMSESSTFFKDGMKKLMKNPLAVASIIALILIILMIIKNGGSLMKILIRLKPKMISMSVITLLVCR